LISIGAAMKFENPSPISILTFVLWFGCLAVGASGFLLPYAHPQPPPPILPPIHAQLLNVQITPQRSPMRQARAPANERDQPPPPGALEAPQAPELDAVAAPNAAVAFALPVAGPPHPATVHKIIYGEGEGQQPAPEYPREAVLAHEEGVVVVRFVVDKDGRVISADAINPCPWPLLNQAALRAISQTWQFAPGPVRSYEVSIQFQLRQRSP
jgi:protein TonB